MVHVMATAAEFWYRLSDAIGNQEIHYPQHWRRARILQTLARACGWIGRSLDRGPVTGQRAALRALRRATALVRERSAQSGGTVPADAPLTLIVIDEAGELLGGRLAGPVRRELARLASMGRRENVAVVTRTDGGA
jgi:hypothetical protein